MSKYVAGFGFYGTPITQRKLNELQRGCSDTIKMIKLGYITEMKNGEWVKLPWYMYTYSSKKARE